jgi:hypothetical protein
VPSARLLCATLTASALALLGSLPGLAHTDGHDQPDLLLETEFGRVAHWRRVALPADDQLLRNLQHRTATPLQFAVKLRPHLRRAIALNSETGPDAAPLIEHTLAAGTTLSERRGRAASYRVRGQPLLLGLLKTDKKPGLVTYAWNGTRYSAVDRCVFGEELADAAGVVLLDLTGNGLLEAAVPLFGGGVAVVEVSAAGKLKLLTTTLLPAEGGGLSVVDLDRDGVWEIETHADVTDPDHPLAFDAHGGARLNWRSPHHLFRWDARAGEFKDVSARYRWLFGSR